MALVPFEPFRQLERVRQELDHLFTGFPLGFEREMGMPRIDLYETDNELIASCEIPGLEKKEDVSIDIEDNVLTITGSIHREHEVKEEQMHRRERFVGRFHRSVTLPAKVAAEGVKATYKNGVLEIRMPKDRTVPKRRIDLEFH
ncbi:MAG: Hsp20/alpha crystallin family protein [Brevibacillus sp.]|nr:Hsp20/alpha crystallin family protein [Brevibacillus sp.]